MMTCTRRLEFDAGHRLQRHESKCAHLHGHRYAVELTCAADFARALRTPGGPDVPPIGLDAVGRVIDFAKVKEVVGGWLDAHLDHALILESTDPLVELLKPHEPRLYTVPFSPTAENLTRYIAVFAEALLRRHAPGVQLKHVRLYETPNGWADFDVPESGSYITWATFPMPKEPTPDAP